MNLLNYCSNFDASKNYNIMNRLFTALTLVIIASIAVFADNGATSNFGDKTPIQIDPIPTKTPQKGPRVPARVPLTCFLMDDCLTVVCDYEAKGEVTVTNNATGMVVASETGELAAGIVLYFTDYTEGAMTVTITLNDKGYIGYF